MSDKLTDEQVAGILRVEAGYCVVDERVRSLALEVQQARQRRCGNCAAWRGPIAAGKLAGTGWCDEHDALGATAPDWSCADFTPKEAR